MHFLSDAFLKSDIRPEGRVEMKVAYRERKKGARRMSAWTPMTKGSYTHFIIPCTQSQVY